MALGSLAANHLLMIKISIDLPAKWPLREKK